MQYQQFRWHRRWLRLTDPLSLKTVENIERNINEADTVFFFAIWLLLVNILIICVFLVYFGLQSVARRR